MWCSAAGNFFDAASASSALLERPPVSTPVLFSFAPQAFFFVGLGYLYPGS
jgi:hypothetical protein